VAAALSNVYDNWGSNSTDRRHHLGEAEWVIEVVYLPVYTCLFIWIGPNLLGTHSLFSSPVIPVLRDFLHFIIPRMGLSSDNEDAEPHTTCHAILWNKRPRIPSWTICLIWNSDVWNSQVSPSGSLLWAQDQRWTNTTHLSQRTT